MVIGFIGAGLFSGWLFYCYPIPSRIASSKKLPYDTGLQMVAQSSSLAVNPRVNLFVDEYGSLRIEQSPQ